MGLFSKGDKAAPPLPNERSQETIRERFEGALLAHPEQHEGNPIQPDARLHTELDDVEAAEPHAKLSDEEKAATERAIHSERTAYSPSERVVKETAPEDRKFVKGE